MEVKKMPRGGSAEHCRRCKINVMPVGHGTRMALTWHCPYCRELLLPPEALQ